MGVKSLLVPGLLGLVISLLFGCAWYTENYVLLLVPIVFAVLYFSLYQEEALFLSIAFFTPLSVNIEEYTNGFGLFLPTEPLLFGLLILFFFYQLKKPFIPTKTLFHPIVILVLIQLLWFFLTSITSTHPIVSFKAIVSRAWFVFPLLIFGTYFFSSTLNIRKFLWLFTLGMTVCIIYTLYNHYLFAFGEKESHWVMSPFFKDHTIYGAAIALVLPFPFILYFSRKNSLLIQLVIVTLVVIVVLGLYFSYTRAAWLSVVGAMMIVSVVLLKIKFRWVLGVGALTLFLVFYKWDSIQMELARNKEEHTTEQFDQRIQSAANVSTDASNLERINRWSCAIEMFKEKPIMGFGLGTFAFEYARFQEPENLTIISTNFGDLGNAHSEYLSALSETGLPGLLLFLGFVIAVFYTTIRNIQKARKDNWELFIYSCGILFSLSTYFIHAFLNNFLDTDKAAVPVFVMLAIVMVIEKKLSAQPEAGI